ncbi:MAG TPA: glycosyltransferase [Xanthobacteraceae bacterium]|nr:glycosyltransferase [Xanthobacteraceae bacterium]
MRFVLLYHSFSSCWNHGNAHFLRGISRELVRLGHGVSVYEPEDGWSRLNALRDGGAQILMEAARLVPGVEVHTYRDDTLDLDRTLQDADVVIVHEWNPPALVAEIGRRRAAGGRFTLLFHDTHHRAVSAPEDIEQFALDGYDAVLAFGEILREVYGRRGWGRRAFTWHEAADSALFRMDTRASKEVDLVWIGNWGDGERGRELEQFLLEPVAELGLPARIHGVRYPEDVRWQLLEAGIDYAGWLPNHRVPDAFARARVTVHVPRRPYVETLPGIPTIRMFEALACGIPLVSAPWDDTEGLFPPGAYLRAGNTEQMTAAIARILRDRDFTRELVRTGLNAIRLRHTCAHRVAELLALVGELQGIRSPQGDTRPEQIQALAS